MSYKRTQLLHGKGYYQWPASNDPEAPEYVPRTGEILDRTSGFEVLHFINGFVNKHWGDVSLLRIYRQAEKMIRFHLPQELTTQEAIEEWLLAHWGDYREPEMF